MDDLSDTAIVVPTMGTRPELLLQCVNSIRAAGCTNIHVVVPDPEAVEGLVALGHVTRVVPDPGLGLAAAINAGISSLPSTVRFANWLGDDDLLTPGSVEIARRVLVEDDTASLVYGACDYVDVEGRRIFRSRSGRWAAWLMYVGPQLVPQPGSLFRVSDFRAVGQLEVAYRFAFDLDLMMKLHRVGRLRYVRHTLSNFRWHADSLSVSGRDGSVEEASQIRLSHVPVVIRPLARIWEPVVRRLIRWAGARVSQRAAAM